MQGNTGLVRPPGDHGTFGIVDELNCYFDSPAEPNNVHLEIWLPGHLDPDRLRDAVTAMLADQPRAAARRADRGWWRRDYAWEFPPQAGVEPVSTTCWQTEADLDLARARFLAAAPPLDRSPPFRLLLARGPGRDSLILNAHHAAFDGRSCLRLLRLIADRYGAGPPAEPPGPPQPPGKQPWGPRPPASQLPGNHSPARRPRPPVRRTVRIASRHASGRRPRRAPGYGFALLGWPGVPAAPQPENEPGVTVNDLLIAALIRAVLRWNASAHRRPGRVRISMPVDVRPPGRGDELGNLTRLCTVAADPLGTAALTAVVADQTRRAKHQPGPLVSPAQAAVARAPLPTPVKRRILRLAVRCLGRLECDTSLLSNLGNITDAPRFGVLSPARMWFSTSAHMPRGLSVGAITVDGQLQLCFRYRHALFDAAAAHDFVAEYAAALAGTEDAVTMLLASEGHAAQGRSAHSSVQGFPGSPCRRLEAWLTKTRTLCSASGSGSSCCCSGYSCSTGRSTTTTARCSPRSCSRSPPTIPPPTSRCGSTHPAVRCRPCSPSATSCGWCRATSPPWRSGWPAAPGSSCSRPAPGASGSRCRTPGRRALLSHARVVLHQPAARGQGPIPDLILQADELVRMRADIEAILSAHTGQSVQTLRTDTDRDRVLTAQAAISRPGPPSRTASPAVPGGGPRAAGRAPPATMALEERAPEVPAGVPAAADRRARARPYLSV